MNSRDEKRYVIKKENKKDVILKNGGMGYRNQPNKHLITPLRGETLSCRSGAVAKELLKTVF